MGYLVLQNSQHVQSVSTNMECLLLAELGPQDHAAILALG